MVDQLNSKSLRRESKGLSWCCYLQDTEGEFFDDDLGSITQGDNDLLDKIADGTEGTKPEDATANSSVSFKCLIRNDSMYIHVTFWH